MPCWVSDGVCDGSGGLGAILQRVNKSPSLQALRNFATESGSHPAAEKHY